MQSAQTLCCPTLSSATGKTRAVAATVESEKETKQNDNYKSNKKGNTTDLPETLTQHSQEYFSLRAKDPEVSMTTGV